MVGLAGWLADPGLHMLPQAYWFCMCDLSGTKPIRARRLTVVTSGTKWMQAEPETTFRDWGRKNEQR